jgi:hypothetical protein
MENRFSCAAALADNCNYSHEVRMREGMGIYALHANQQVRNKLQGKLDTSAEQT